MKTNKREGRFDPRLIGKSIQRDTARLLALGQEVADDANDLAASYSDDTSDENYGPAMAKKLIASQTNQLRIAAGYVQALAKAMAVPARISANQDAFIRYINQYESIVQKLRRWAGRSIPNISAVSRIANKLIQQAKLLNAVVPLQRGAAASPVAALLGRELTLVGHLYKTLRDEWFVYETGGNAIERLYRDIQGAIQDLKRIAAAKESYLTEKKIVLALAALSEDARIALDKDIKRNAGSYGSATNYTEGKRAIAKLAALSERLSRLASNL